MGFSQGGAGKVEQYIKCIHKIIFILCHFYDYKKKKMNTVIFIFSLIGGRPVFNSLFKDAAIVEHFLDEINLKKLSYKFINYKIVLIPKP